MKKTAIVVDSTGYLTNDILECYQIRVVPLNVTIGNETFPETDLTNEDLFNKINKITEISKTSQPSVGSFINTYEKLFSEGAEEIISIHLSSAISGTIVAARMARDLVSKQNIYFFDSGSAALGLGLLAWAAGELAEQGANALEIIDRLNYLKERTELYFIVDTLEYLKMGGRIGGASALIGTLLQIKPILYINKSGEIDVFDKVRSSARAWQRVLEQLRRALSANEPYRICIQHVHASPKALEILAELKNLFPGHEIRTFEAGPVIATHVGPGAFGLAFHPCHSYKKEEFQ